MSKVAAFLDPISALIGKFTPSEALAGFVVLCITVIALAVILKAKK